MNDGILPAHLTCESDQFGALERAGAFVYREYEPANDATTEYVVKFLSLLDVFPKGQKTRKKYIRCMSDFLMATRTTTTGKISWAGAAQEYDRNPYGYDVAKAVRGALIAKGHITLAQRASKRDGLSRLYTINKLTCPSDLIFKQHGEGALVIVKSEKVRVRGQVEGGIRLGRTKFQPELKVLEEEIAQINMNMVQHPLCGSDGTQYVRCYRIFNNGSLEAGGRLYGRWQGLSEQDRLMMTIDGERVCEIDIKASFLSIAFAGSGANQSLAADPYQMIKFVAKGGENKSVLRTVAKLLVNAYLCKEGELTQFPKGKRSKGKTVSFRNKYDLKHNCKYYMKQIHDAFPFLKDVKQDGFGLMYQESKIMLNAMQALLRKGSVSFPVHDCLLVKQKDQDAAIEALQAALRGQLNYVPTMDVSWLDDSGRICTKLIIPCGKSQISSNHDSMTDSFEPYLNDDFELFDDFHHVREAKITPPSFLY